MKSGYRLLTAILAVALLTFPAAADEGMWLFEAFPKQLVEQKHGFQVTDDFLNRLRMASLRVLASGSFVSPEGLIFTNHHVALDCIQKLSSSGNDYVANGFYAATQGEERTCPDQHADQLVTIENVTAKVSSAVKPGSDEAMANRDRQAMIARIEKECTGRTGNICEVVTLYSGGRYHLYQYKRYTDIRLVFAPEMDIGFFGGDPDNFTYPRYALDISFFRAYENGRPARTPNYFRWSRDGVRENELTFVPGNPGTTGRLLTVAQLEFARDYSYPLIHRRLASLIRALEAYSAGSPENERVARDNMLSQTNSYKAYTGFLAGLRDPNLMASKSAGEKKLRSAVAADPARQAQYGKAWDRISAAYQKYPEFQKQHWLLESGARGSELFRIARNTVRLSEERRKPNEERLREYRDSALPELERNLYSPAPITDSMEIAVLTDYLEFLQKELGNGDPVVKAVLNGRPPAQAANEYVRTTKLKDVSERKRLAQDPKAVRTSNDGMIRLALALDEPARRLRKLYEDTVEAVVTSEGAKIAQARFAVFGESEYPDATFTPRLTFGPVKGYRSNDGRQIPYTTTLEGLFNQATGQPPYRLPERWLKTKPTLDLKAQLNFVTTADTHGGNSGSPTLNTRGEIIGILFDGNIESLPNRFVYTDAQARSVHVASQGILEALRKVYKTDRLLDEIGMGQQREAGQAASKP